MIISYRLFLDFRVNEFVILLLFVNENNRLYRIKGKIYIIFYFICRYWLFEVGVDGCLFRKGYGMY